ncbi:MAG: GntR family transcriptional regulator [Chitinophagia bacterium]|jgi:GntR family transcriptional regulator|nr:GntR family transcriptional regulator [Chitinophagia bacterium]
MAQPWRDDQPIWRQIRERVISAILEGELKEGEAIPSVRQVAIEMQVNPLTVSRAYQDLADEKLVERRRGLGMFVVSGARQRLGASEREIFLRDEWPAVVDRIQRLGLSLEDLLQSANGDRK